MLQSDIFGNWNEVKEPEVPENSNRKLKTMQDLHGIKEDETCKTCAYTIKKSYSSTYYKCGQWHMSNSSVTDIRLKDLACSRWRGKIVE